MYGSSINNQRIEPWWSIFRKGRFRFWMELFADLRDAVYFNGSHEHQCLLRYCFGDVIQKDLDECVRLWNSHRIRPFHVQEECPMNSTTYHTGLAPETADFKLNRLNWMPFLRLACQ